MDLQNNNSSTVTFRLGGRVHEVLPGHTISLSPQQVEHVRKMGVKLDDTDGREVFHARVIVTPALLPDALIEKLDALFENPNEDTLEAAYEQWDAYRSSAASQPSVDKPREPAKPRGEKPAGRRGKGSGEKPGDTPPASESTQGEQTQVDKPREPANTES